MTTEYQHAWRRFLDTFEPLRGELYRYCRYLTRSPWDAEDLAQDTLARGFATLAKMDAVPPNPRAWLFRVASNVWIDQLRKRRAVPADDGIAPAVEPRASREAAGTLLVTLSPQERAAVVLKDVFELSLDDVAVALNTTVGTVKTALHRGRGKLVDDDAPEPTAVPLPGALDAFCHAFNAGDLDRLTALLLDTSIVDVVGATTQYGPEAARRTVLFGMLFGTRLMAGPDNPLDPELTRGVLADSPRLELRHHRDRWLGLSWYKHADGIEAVRAVTTFGVDGDRIAHLENYFYTPEFLHDLGAELGVPIRVNGHRWWR
jgi:RNA polymerase sigma-70 factor, ECF subfamily